MAKVQQKSEKISAFGGIFFVLDKFDRILSSVIDSHLGLRSRLIAYLENRDGNANVRFMQAETHRRFFEMMRSFGIHVRSFRADCGSYSEDIVKMVMEFRFIAVPAKWVRTARQYKLNIYSAKPYNIIWEHG